MAVREILFKKKKTKQEKKTDQLQTLSEYTFFFVCASRKLYEYVQNTQYSDYTFKKNTSPLHANK